MLEAPWVGRTPEEDHYRETGEKEYTVYFTMRGSITVYATDCEGAEEQVKNFIPNRELVDYVDEIEVDEID